LERSCLRLISVVLKEKDDGSWPLDDLTEPDGMTVGRIAAPEDSDDVFKLAAPSFERIRTFVYVARGAAGEQVLFRVVLGTIVLAGGHKFVGVFPGGRLHKFHLSMDRRDMIGAPSLVKLVPAVCAAPAKHLPQRRSLLR